MDNELKAKIKVRIIAGCIILLLVAGVIAWTYKILGIQRKAPADNDIARVQAPPHSAETGKSLFAAEEEQREVYLQQVREEQELAKKKLRKEKSHECQFWLLQQKQGKSPVASQKVAEHCVLTAEESSTQL